MSDAAAGSGGPSARLSLIVAMARNRVIGRDGRLPWRLSADLQRFKSLTMGHHIIMGRNTWESIARLLPGRTTVIVTRRRDYQVPGAIVVDSLDAAIAACRNDDEIFIIGGAQLYTAALPRANRIYLTQVDADIEGDTLMPQFDLAQWREHSSQIFAADEKNPYNYKLTVYDRG